MFIQDPGSRVKKIPGPGSGSASKDLCILTQKIVSMSRKCDPVVHPGSGPRIQIRIFYPSRIQGVEKEPDPGFGSATLLLYLVSLPAFADFPNIVFPTSLKLLKAFQLVSLRTVKCFTVFYWIAIGLMILF
jgi:hypothetical protein